MVRKCRADNGFSKAWLVAAILIVVIVIAGGGTAYYFTHKSSQKAEPKTPLPNSASIPKPKVPTVSKAQAANQSSTLNIKELGVQVVVPSQLAGLTYTATTASSSRGDLTTVQFIMKSYSSLANQCAGQPDKTAHPFANLSKATAPSANASAASVIKQFTNYTIVNSGSSVPPSVTCKDAATGQQLKALNDQLDSSLKDMFQTAKQI